MVFEFKRRSKGPDGDAPPDGDDTQFKQSLAALTSRLAERNAKAAAAAPAAKPAAPKPAAPPIRPAPPPMQARAPEPPPAPKPAAPPIRPAPPPVQARPPEPPIRPAPPPMQARAPEPPPAPKPAAPPAAAPPPPAAAPPPMQARAPEPPPAPAPKADVLRPLVREKHEAPKAPPKLGPAVVDEPPPRPALPRRRSSFGFAILWLLGIGAGAVAAGAFVGFLVNGPPNRSMPRPLGGVAPPSMAVEAATPRKIAATTQAPAAPSATRPAPAAPAAAVPAAAAPTPAPAPVAPPAAPPAGTEAARETPPPPAPPPPAANAGQLASGEIVELQGRLRAIGFNPGPLDGSAGPMTSQAVKQYQQARRLAPTGNIDRELLARLRQERGTGSPPGWTQQAQAPPQGNAPPQRRDNFMETIDRLLRH